MEDRGPGGKREKTIMDHLKESVEELGEVRGMLGFPPYAPPPSPAIETSEAGGDVRAFSLEALEFIVQLLRSDTGDLRRRVAEFNREFHAQLGD